MSPYPYWIASTEESAAEILVQIQSSSSPAVRSRSEGSIPSPTPLPRNRGYSSRPRYMADDSDDTILMGSSQGNYDEDFPEISLENIVRRNPARRARPGRMDFN